MRYLVFNATDGVYASPESMTLEEAEQFIKEARERYRKQGYYASCAGRIPIEALELEIEEAR